MYEIIVVDLHGSASTYIVNGFRFTYNVFVFYTIENSQTITHFIPLQHIFEIESRQLQTKHPENLD